MDDYTNAWNSFYETGNVSDYLNYKHTISNYMKNNSMEFGTMESNHEKDPLDDHPANLKT